MILQIPSLNAWIDKTNGYILAGCILAFVGSAIAFVCYLPGILKVIKTHDTRGISALMFGFTTFGCTVWVVVSILYIIGFTKGQKGTTPNIEAGLSAGLPTLISNLGLGICSAGMFIFKMKHIRLAKKNHMDLNTYVSKIVAERELVLKAKSQSKEQH